MNAPTISIVAKFWMRMIPVSLIMVLLSLGHEVCSADDSLGGLRVERQAYGSMPDGRQVDRYTLTNANGVEVGIMTLGATLTTVKTPDRDGNLAIITLHKNSLDEYVAGHPLFGSVVGRFANRIANARFSIDGATYSLTRNAGPHHIHGGGKGEGFAWQVWQGKPIQQDHSVGVQLTLVSPDGQAGFPGRLDTRVIYRLTDDNRLIMEYRATTDRPTHVNLTNHAYWNLAGADTGNDVLGHELELNADYYLPSDDAKMPTGDILSVKSTPMDFTTARAVGANVDQTDFGYYDHCYVLNKTRGTELKFCARVVEPTTGRVMTVHTTQPGVQLYTGNQHGLCLETQHYPNSPNEPDFPSTLLRPDKVFHEITIHQFGITESRQ
jgi:aldose 1-epimerase